MPRAAKPHYDKARGRWWAKVGPPDSQGRATRIFAPKALGLGPKDTAKAWAWMEQVAGQARRFESPVDAPNLAALFTHFRAALADRVRARAEGRPGVQGMSEKHYQNRELHLKLFASYRPGGGRAFAEYLASEMTPEVVSDFLRSNAGTYRPVYLANISQSVRAAFRWACKPGSAGPGKRFLESNPIEGFEGVSVPSPGERYAPTALAAEFLRFWRRHADRFGVKVERRTDERFGLPVKSRRFDRLTMLLVRCLMRTGARPAELVDLRWSDLRWDAGRTTDGRSYAKAIIPPDRWKTGRKTSKPRRIFFTPATSRALKREFGRPDRHPVFVFIHGRGRGGVGEGQPWKDSTILSRRILTVRRALIAYQEELRSRRTAGVELMPWEARAVSVTVDDSGDLRVTNYLWRHTAISSLLMMGVDVATVAELAGTSVEMIRKHYGHLIDKHLAEAAEKLGRRRA